MRIEKVVELNCGVAQSRLGVGKEGNLIGFPGKAASEIFGGIEVEEAEQ